MRQHVQDMVRCPSTYMVPCDIQRLTETHYKRVQSYEYRTPVTGCSCPAHCPVIPILALSHQICPRLARFPAPSSTRPSAHSLRTHLWLQLQVSSRGQIFFCSGSAHSQSVSCQCVPALPCQPLESTQLDTVMGAQRVCEARDGHMACLYANMPLSCSLRYSQLAPQGRAAPGRGKGVAASPAPPGGRTGTAPGRACPYACTSRPSKQTS